MPIPKPSVYIEIDRRIGRKSMADVPRVSVSALCNRLGWVANSSSEVARVKPILIHLVRNAMAARLAVAVEPYRNRQCATAKNLRILSGNCLPCGILSKSAVGGLTRLLGLEGLLPLGRCIYTPILASLLSVFAFLRQPGDVKVKLVRCGCQVKAMSVSSYSDVGVKMSVFI